MVTIKDKIWWCHEILGIKNIYRIIEDRCLEYIL